MTNQKVWVAIIPTYYETISVALTKREAVRAASHLAWQFLRDRDALIPETSTPAKTAKYLGVNCFQITIGTAQFTN